MALRVFSVLGYSWLGLTAMIDNSSAHFITAALTMESASVVVGHGTPIERYHELLLKGPETCHDVN